MSPPPSLRALRVLVEVARSGSAASAASRLGITASAVSHLLAELEAQLGGPLFSDRRRAQLNDKGARLVQRLDPAFQSIDMALQDFRAGPSCIRLSTLSSFALLWLIPRLPRLRQVLPDVDILVSTDTRCVDLSLEPYDCVIRWVGPQADWRGLDHHLLFHEELILVASPRLLPRWQDAPRLGARSRPQDWDLFHAAPASGAATIFETRSQMIEAAIAGLGLAIIDRRLVESALANTLLTQVGGHSLKRPEGYAFAARPLALENKNLRQFRRWLLDEARGQ